VAQLKPSGTAVVNADDPAWAALPPAPSLLTFGIEHAAADVRACDIEYGARGSVWTLRLKEKAHRVRLPLIGAFNVANALAAAAAAHALGASGARIAERLTSLPQVPGRLELLAERPIVLRDYAHTPDALERALAALRPLVRGRLMVLFGCGGDRDRGKRPQMGAIAERLADVVVVTSDNPRTEDPERILDDIEAGMDGREGVERLRIEDRRVAIARALDAAEPDDVVLLAGKGHETYQIRGTTRYPFDEKQIVHELLRRRGE
jgi:UDP-N-acetylmuramoyl-L-alanyl-D-glutamate--2,6-diaminopimelate ligase